MITQIILIAAIVGLIVYDVLAKVFSAPTESSVLRTWGEKYTALPFCAGILLGHWFINHNNLWLSGWMYAAPMIVALVIWDFVWNRKTHVTVWYRYPGLWALIGVPVGAFLWGQSL